MHQNNVATATTLRSEKPSPQMNENTDLLIILFIIVDCTCKFTMRLETSKLLLVQIIDHKAPVVLRGAGNVDHGQLGRILLKIEEVGLKQEQQWHRKH